VERAQAADLEWVAKIFHNHEVSIIESGDCKIFQNMLSDSEGDSVWHINHSAKKICVDDDKCTTSFMRTTRACLWRHEATWSKCPSPRQHKSIRARRSLISSLIDRTAFHIWSFGRGGFLSAGKMSAASIFGHRRGCHSILPKSAYKIVVDGIESHPFHPKIRR
jgi:hypothetical protein